MLLFDSTTITLCLSLFPWAEFRRQKGGIKLHVLLDSSDYMPFFVHITEAKMHDSKATQLFSLRDTIKSCGWGVEAGKKRAYPSVSNFTTK
ncbi:MAG TPA: hypothetical protein DCG87_02880 [Synergistaceae bacterium]|nr:hypothetical protein [Synergistaceae bacterium]